MNKSCAIIDKYKIIKRIGKGGTSEVYLAENIFLNTYWAAKKIDKTNKIYKNLSSEIEILKKLKHQYLPMLIDVIEDSQYIYIIEELIDGKTLDKIIAEEKKICEKNVIEILKKICDALGYLHNQKPAPIIFRDLKPSNIIISENGNIKLLDFGIAREYKPEKEKDTVFIGTKGYAAPEQYGSSQTDERSDIYSLGVTLHHMVTGKEPYKPPFGFGNIRKYNPKISRNLENIINKCIKYNPDERFQNIKELMKSLEKTKIDSLNLKEKVTKRKVFKQTTIGILNNSDFACEFARVASILTDFKVSFINLDIFCNNIDIFFDIELKDEKNISNIIKFSGEDIVDFFSYKIGDNLSIFTDNESVLQDNIKDLRDIKGILDEFDLNILNLNYYNIENIKMCSEFVYVNTGNYNKLRSYDKILEYLFANFQISRDKVKFVAYNYMKYINAPFSDIKNYVGKDGFLGVISFCSQKEKLINLETCNKKSLNKKIIREYKEILSRYNIL